MSEIVAIREKGQDFLSQLISEMLRDDRDICIPLMAAHGYREDRYQRFAYGC